MENKSLSNQELLRVCQPAGDVLKGTINPHFCHETGETAINHLIRQKYAAELLRKQCSPIEKLNEIIRPLVAKLPTESWRSREQNALQQFSTPPAISYLLAYLMNLQPGETALEPSAGTGNLAVWATGLRIKTYVNEIDPRRRELLDILGFQPTGYNAEFINDLLTPEIKADVIMMNPPFSANGERTANNSSKYGFRHVESALERLEKGGKFGIILGKAAELKTKTGNEFWCKMARRIEVKTIIKITGRKYYKNGSAT